MPVLLNFRAISAALCITIIGGCSPKTQAPVADDLSYETLSTEIGEIEVNIAAVADLPGATQAEKLLYQAGIVSQMQTAMLVMFDTQAKTLRLAGNSEIADELDNSRPLMMEAVNIELDVMIADAGLLYEKYLEPSEIERLIVLHSDPAMQKLIRNQPQMAQGMLPIGEDFGVRVGARYQELLTSKKDE
jgi:hypothetical protein